MKAVRRPCPLDQISIICFKRCPYLRTISTRLICTVWKSGNIPHKWKNACTILVHKKGDKNDPANFRPITLELVPLKTFTSCLRDSIFSFLSQNHLIEQKIQKGFIHGVSGVLEHTSMLAYLINKARIKQRSAIITLLDLKNAFGEVDHNLSTTVLAYRHVPDMIQSLVTDLYTDFHSYVISDRFSTPAIPFRRGVLQGDCLSPLLFNLCFTTFIQFGKQEKYNQLGFSPHDENDRLFHPVHWFQFVDNAAVIIRMSAKINCCLTISHVGVNGLVCKFEWTNALLSGLESSLPAHFNSSQSFSVTLKSYRLSKMASPSNTLDVSSILIWITRIIRKVLNPPFNLC